MDNKNTKSTAIIDNVTEYGSSAIGSATGAIIGGAIAGPAGAIGGSLGGTLIENILKWGGKEIKERLLSKTEEQKLETVHTLACKKITQNLDSGKRLRTDTYFSESTNNRSYAEEILERTLFAAQRECEDKKIKYYAKIYANIAFDNSISRNMANQLLKLAEQLTYRQIVLLHTIGVQQMATSPNFMKKTAYTSVNGLENVMIASEIYELYRMSLLSSSSVIFDSAGINPSALSITGYGALLFNLMELNILEEDEDLPSILSDVMLFLMDEKF